MFKKPPTREGPHLQHHQQLLVGPLLCQMGKSLVTELKPQTLAHDASAGELRIWLKKFEVCYIALGRQNAPTAMQHAYFLNCLDSELSLQLDGCITTQTALLGPN